MENQATQTPKLEPAQWKDPILLELHAVRERLANEYGNDIHAICEAARLGAFSNINLNRAR